MTFQIALSCLPFLSALNVPSLMEGEAVPGEQITALGSSCAAGSCWAATALESSVGQGEKLLGSDPHSDTSALEKLTAIFFSPLERLVSTESGT